VGDREITSNNRGFEMRKIIYSVGAMAVTAAIIFIWSNSVVVGPRAVSASAIGTVENTQPTETTPRIVPLEIMVQLGKNLPVEDLFA
jgi:hypothetical protein